MPDQMRLRRLVDRHEVIGRMFPLGAVAVRRRLREPTGAMAGLWFLSDIAQKHGRLQRKSIPRRTMPGHQPQQARRTAVDGEIGADSIRVRHTESAGE
jgi:hypothetical protein